MLLDWAEINQIKGNFVRILTDFCYSFLLQETREVEKLNAISRSLEDKT